ncbi:MAG: hypothetical protein HY646_06685 [Acidobacteria bacterium]|nr:hypothetical protein [Acidobacteriota bacterium]
MLRALYRSKARIRAEVKADMELAPCIAVIGPANAGKTTLLHQLDERLQKRLTAVHVIKGNPDHTGRYQFQAPNLREALKSHVKGMWGSSTIEHICESIDCGRRNLEVALLDFGGKHNPENDRMLALCSHYVVVSRLADVEGGASWDMAAAQNGLKRIAWMRSLGPRDECVPVIATSVNGLDGTFRYDVQPGESVNDAVIERLAEEIVALRRDLDLIPYIDLHASERWTEADIPDVKGRATKIREVASRMGEAVLGGAAPIWAYLAGLRCALEANPGVRVFFFDPKQPEPLVEIPQQRREGPFPERVLELHWTEQSGQHRLEFHMLRDDKFLPPEAAQQLAGAPGFGKIPGQEVSLWGKGPTWLSGAYARWLVAAGVERLSAFDATMQKTIRIWQ